MTNKRRAKGHAGPIQAKLGSIAPILAIQSIVMFTKPLKSLTPSPRPVSLSSPKTLSTSLAVDRGRTLQRGDRAVSVAALRTSVGALDRRTKSCTLEFRPFFSGISTYAEQ
jgi:hypothetical protein